MENGAVLTKDNMLRRKWKGNPDRYFCDQKETQDHLFFTCSVAKVIWACIAQSIGATDIPDCLKNCWLWLEKRLPHNRKFHVWGVAAICWAIWKARNKACFEKKLIKNPAKIICHARALMKFWAGLFAADDKKILEEGVDAMIKIALNILSNKKNKPDQSHSGGGPSDG